MFLVQFFANEILKAQSRGFKCKKCIRDPLMRDAIIGVVKINTKSYGAIKVCILDMASTQASLR